MLAALNAWAFAPPVEVKYPEPVASPSPEARPPLEGWAREWYRLWSRSTNFFLGADAPYGLNSEWEALPSPEPEEETEWIDWTAAYIAEFATSYSYQAELDAEDDVRERTMAEEFLRTAVEVPFEPAPSPSPDWPWGWPSYSYYERYGYDYVVWDDDWCDIFRDIFPGEDKKRVWHEKGDRVEVWYKVFEASDTTFVEREQLYETMINGDEYMLVSRTQYMEAFSARKRSPPHPLLEWYGSVGGRGDEVYRINDRYSACVIETWRQGQEQHADSWEDWADCEEYAHSTEPLEEWLQERESKWSTPRVEQLP